jgi:acylphosphatase
MTKRIVVHGRVQGVGFRYFTEQVAKSLGVTGEVWNRRDGAVEAIASHDDGAVLDTLTERLQHGPGYVQRVDAFDAADAPAQGFRIGATR